MSDEKKKLDEDSLRAVRDWTNCKFTTMSSICPVYDEEEYVD